MELTQALQILKEEKAKKAEEVTAYDLAISILENTYAPELQVIANANTAIQSLTAEITSKESLIQSLSAEKETLLKSTTHENIAVEEISEKLI